MKKSRTAYFANQEVDYKDKSVAAIYSRIHGLLTKLNRQRVKLDDLLESMASQQYDLLLDGSAASAHEEICQLLNDAMAEIQLTRRNVQKLQRDLRESADAVKVAARL